MPQIHPTALVDARARLAPEVVVGPWCLIEGEVEVGAGCRLHERVSLRGPLSVEENNTFYSNVSVGGIPQDRQAERAGGGRAGVRIGSGNIFREGVTIHHATGDRPTTVGNDNYLMVNCHLAHDVVVGDRCTFANGVLVAGHVQIQDGVNLGGNATIHQFVRLGRLSMIGGLSGVGQDMPPFCVSHVPREVAGLNLVGLRRAGYRDHIAALKEAFRILYQEPHSNPVAANLIEQQLGEDPLCRELVAFIRSSQRGLVDYGPAR